MRVIVGKHNIQIERETINEKELNITYCTFEFDEDIDNSYNKFAYFTKGSSSYKMLITDDRCDIPTEITNTPGKIELGVSYYKIENGVTTRYNPSSAYFYVIDGSIKSNTKNGLYITTPSELEQFENEFRDFIKEANIDIDVNKSGKVATVTTTNANGEHHSVEIYDGADGEQGPQGIQGIQGPQGEQGVPGKDGVDGKDGKDGIDGKDGTNGTDGVDGYSPSARVDKVDNTATITIIDKNGTTTASISDGTNGTNGQDGYTPVKGVDYFTQEDIASLNIPSDLNDLTNNAGYIKGLVQLTYGTSTWNDFQAAYNDNKIVYCAIDGRRAFMAYVSNNNVEFQYYRSLSSPSASSQVDEVYVYKLTNANVWSTTTRNASNTITAGTGLTRTYTANTRTVDLSVDTTTIATKQYVDNAITGALTSNY